ncbi:MAG: sulfatase/phosphatase domain-containing protein, partial [Verrucomicrobiota bacterium]
EKNHWHKTTLWEEATRVPFIIFAPGFSPGRSESPVSLIDLFPTLNDLCGFPEVPEHDGMSLVPLLEDPQNARMEPAIIQFKVGNVAVRSERFRYIRYQDGSEEFYDHQVDPYEWTNLATHPDYETELSELATWATTTWSESARKKPAFAFDPNAFTWTEKSSGRRIDGREHLP